jgi:hypothetical protein
MAIVALVAEKKSRIKYEADSTHALLSTGTKLAEFCQTDEEPKKADFSRLLFVLTDSDPAFDTLHAITAGISSTWNPQPGQLRVIYTQVGKEQYDCSAVARVAAEATVGKRVVVIIGCRESLQELLLLMTTNSALDPNCELLPALTCGFPDRAGETLVFDTDTREVTALDPRASEATPEKEEGDGRSRAIA